VIPRSLRASTCALLALVTAATTSHANGRFPASNMLVANPRDPSHLALRATYGVLFSSDSGATWDWVCEKAIGYGGAEDPSLVLTGSGAVVVGMFHGMARSDDFGCTWQHDAAWPQSVVDLALRKATPDTVVAATCVFSRVADAGGSLFKNEVTISEDAGKTWTTRATIDPTLLIDSIEVSESSAQRVYVSAIRPRGKETAGVLLVSDDGGAHFQEHAVPFGTDERGVYIAAVDPHDAARVYLRTTGVDAGRLLVTTDAGKTFRAAMKGGPLQGFALADDGASLFVGGPRDGLLRATAAAEGFEKRSTLGVQCLASVGPTLWACAPSTAGYVLGASSDGGGSFTPKLTLSGMRGPAKCSSGAGVADVCAADWTQLRALVSPRLPDPVAPDASPPATAEPAKGRACGCATPGSSAESPLSLALAAALVALVLHRRREEAPDRRRLARSRRALGRVVRARQHERRAADDHGG
jgi:MYXO-CTERM domain-containing protein